jgi:hypothetical protein
LSRDESILAVGALSNNGKGSDSGYCMLKLNGIEWTQLGNEIDGETAGDKFGHSMLLPRNDGRFNDGNSANSGHIIRGAVPSPVR